MRKTWLLGLVCALGFASGCSPLYVLDVRDDLRKTAFPAPPPGPRVQGTAQVAVLATPSLAVTPLLPQRIHLIAPQPERDDADVWRDRAGDDPGLRTAVVIKGLGTALTERLSAHLRLRFSDARIGVTTQPIPRGTGAIQVRMSNFALILGFYKRAAIVTLTAERDGLPPLVATGTSSFESWAGHLGWQIPVILVLGIWVGMIIALPANNAIVRGVEERRTLEALDIACANLAAALAGNAPVAASD